VKENHTAIVNVLIPFIKGPVIVPCDGKGTWARLWPREGLFSDLNYGEGRCKRGSCLSLLQEAEQHYTQGTIILMYCLALLSKEEVEKINYLVSTYHFSLVIIDTTRKEIGLKMYPINNLVQVSSEEMIPHLASFYHDTTFSRKTIKYSNQLLLIEDPYFPSSSTYSDYWQIMKPLHDKNKSSKGTIVCATLSEWLVFKDCSKTYLATIGIMNPQEEEFIPHKRLYLRRVYSAPSYWYNCIPPSFEKIQTKNRVFFVCADVANNRARFESQNSNVMINMVLEFHSFNSKLEPMEDALKVFHKYKKTKFTREEFEQILDQHSVKIDKDDLTMFLEKSVHVQSKESRKTKRKEYFLKYGD